MPALRTTKPHPTWASLLTICLVVAILITAKSVLVPVALGVILAFALTPIVRAFDRLRVPRPVGVALCLVISLSFVGGVAYVLGSQVTELSEQATRYNSSMREKVRELRKHGAGGLSGLSRTVDKISEQLDENAAALRSAQPVRVIPARLTPIERLRDAAGAFFQPIASAIIVLALVAFMLSQREDLRDRIIRLIGSDNITLTTRLIDEAGHRVSQFLIAQTLINLGVGLLVAAGLYWIGVPYAILWGGLTAVLRFVPYVGTTLSALMPAALAFAIFPGWVEVLQTATLFAILDLLAGYFVEPIVLGQRTGVSSFALLVSALFWIWVWGPVGLVLATPLTVCIGVLGRHVRSLRFLAVLLADEPALSPRVRYFQRLLARDETEARDMIHRYTLELGRTGVCDEVVVPALVLTQQHYTTEEITAEDARFVLDVTHEIVRELPSSDAPRQRDVRWLGLAPSSDIDQSLLDVVAHAIDAPAPPVELISPDLSAEELEALAAQVCPAVVLMTALTPQGVADLRSHCRRLRARLGNAKLIVLHPPLVSADLGRAAQRLRDAGADIVVNTVQELLAALEPIYPQTRPPERPTSEIALKAVGAH
ncbi:MAG: AI-2E family transporter [Steroidobacteraceae bacterium]